MAGNGVYIAGDKIGGGSVEKTYTFTSTANFTYYICDGQEWAAAGGTINEVS